MQFLKHIAALYDGQVDEASVLLHLGAEGVGKTFPAMCIPRQIEKENAILNKTAEFRCLLAYVGFGHDLRPTASETRDIKLRLESHSEVNSIVQKILLSRILLVLRLVLKFHDIMNKDSTTDAQPQMPIDLQIPMYSRFHQNSVPVSTRIYK